MATPEFLFGLRLGEEVEIQIEKGKTLIVKLVSISEPQSDATRVIYFELNGQPREVIIEDVNLESDVVRKMKADPANRSSYRCNDAGNRFKSCCRYWSEGEKRGTSVNH